MLNKNKLNCAIYWVLSCTWGVLATLLGSCVALVLIITKHRPCRYKNGIMFEFGTGWGGLCLGPFQFVNNHPSNKMKDHEYGHSLQNIIFGPLFLFVIGIPSLVRCYLYNHKQTHKQLGFINLVCFIFLALTLGFCMISILLNSLVMIVLGGTIFFYGVGIFVFLIVTLSQFYNNKPCPDYYDIWFEKQATKLGSSCK